MINHAVLLRKFSSQYLNWKMYRSDQADNTIVKIAKDLEKDAVVPLPPLAILEIAVAQAHLEFQGGNIGAALLAMSVKSLMNFGDGEMAHGVQVSFFKRMYGGKLRDCDAAREAKREKLFAEVKMLTAGVLSASETDGPPGCLGIPPWMLRHPPLDA